MPRTKRELIPNIPYHVYQRGHNKDRIFLRAHDYQLYIRTLAPASLDTNCRIFAYALMPNHVHMLIRPGDNADGLSELMRRVAGTYAHHFNKQHNRIGALWDGRFKCKPVLKEHYFPELVKYIELNPVRAKLVKGAKDYLWSSARYRHNLEPINWNQLGT